MLSTDSNLKEYPKRLFLNERIIPFNIKFKIWLGNFLTWFGLIFFIFGIPFTLAFNPFAFLSVPTFNNTDPVAAGVITEVFETGASINEVRVYKYNFSYEGSDGTTQYGTGYSTGNSKSVGEEVNVTYKADNQLIAQASGLRFEEFDMGAFSLLILLFPAAGLILAWVGTNNALRQIQILKVGKLADGKFIGQEPTNVEINNQRVYALTFEFIADDNQVYRTIAKTHLVHRLKDEETEKLVYTPGDPEKAVLLDTLPKRIKEYFLREIRG